MLRSLITCIAVVYFSFLYHKVVRDVASPPEMDSFRQPLL